MKSNKNNTQGKKTNRKVMFFSYGRRKINIKQVINLKQLVQWIPKELNENAKWRLREMK